MLHCMLRWYWCRVSMNMYTFPFVKCKRNRLFAFFQFFRPLPFTRTNVCALSLFSTSLCSHTYMIHCDKCKPRLRWRKKKKICNRNPIICDVRREICEIFALLKVMRSEHNYSDNHTVAKCARANEWKLNAMTTTKTTTTKQKNTIECESVENCSNNNWNQGEEVKNKTHKQNCTYKMTRVIGTQIQTPVYNVLFAWEWDGFG